MMAVVLWVLKSFQPVSITMAEECRAAGLVRARVGR